jgi:PPOX class probable F420-dependent enzyme
MIFDPDDPQGAHALRRLATDRIAWLTTVTPGGQPQSTPVWFLWTEEGEILVYGDHRALRNRNIGANPKVSFHLRDDGAGGDIVVIQGVARIEPDYPAVPDNPAYLERYRPWIDSGLGGPYQMAQTYSMPILIRPTRGTAFPG